MEEQCEEKHCKLLYEYVIMYGVLVFSPFPLRTAVGHRIQRCIPVKHL